MLPASYKTAVTVDARGVKAGKTLKACIPVKRTPLFNKKASMLCVVGDSELGSGLSRLKKEKVDWSK